jgi:hypothetical protein
MPFSLKTTPTLEVPPDFAFEVAVLPKRANAVDVLLSFAFEAAVLPKAAPAEHVLVASQFVVVAA